MNLSKFKKHLNILSEYEYMEYHAHSGRVVNISLSADRQSIVSAAEDGTIFVQSIKEMCNGIDMNLNVTLMATSSSVQH
jgi:WD40 repeat protein